MSSSKKPFCRPSLNLLLVLALIEAILFHWYYWDASFVPADKNENAHVLPDSIQRHKEDMGIAIERYSKAEPYPPFGPLKIPARNRSQTNDTGMGVNVTIQKLLQMGVNRSELNDFVVQQLPAWSQVLENFGEEPVILGLERCQAFRRAVRPRERMLAPAGLFSTGTNILDQLLMLNCLSPAKSVQKRGKQFIPWQVPWGKHNPATSRMQHAAQRMEYKNQSSVLPIVTVRHPFTWLYALCKHPYSLKWEHDKEYCDKRLFLNNPVRSKWGANHSKIPIQSQYDSLAHVWRDWNAEYFQEEGYPFLITRLEDLVYRPKAVVTEICACVGGTMVEDFTVKQESANRGYGHGEHRSDLLSAFIKFGQPLSLFEKEMFMTRDWKVIRDVLDNDHGMMEAFGYLKY